jgi:hypothetical protein
MSGPSGIETAAAKIGPVKGSGFRLDDIVVGGRDSRNRPVTDVYVKVATYAIYRSDGMIFVQFDDTAAVSAEQMGRAVPLIVARDRLESLTRRFWRKSWTAHYHARLANALRIALDGDSMTAKTLLAIAIQEATEDLARWTRVAYIAGSGIFAIIIASLLFWWGYWLSPPVPDSAALAAEAAAVRPAPSAAIRPEEMALLLFAMGGGALGALLSSAIAIRGRAVGLDPAFWTNVLDGFLRVMIGVVSAAALYLLVALGLTIDLAGTKLLGNVHSWMGAIMLGVFAGFLERLVPDLLDHRQKEPLIPVPVPITVPEPAQDSSPAARRAALG